MLLQQQLKVHGPPHGTVPEEPDELLLEEPGKQAP